MIHAVTARRSIRKYKSDEVPLPYIEEILKAGTLAPSSKNRQPWRFTVVQGKAKKEMLSAMERGLYDLDSNRALDLEVCGSVMLISHMRN